MNMQTEPIRLPALIAAAVVVVLAIVIAVVLKVDINEAIVIVIGAFGLTAPAIAFTESKRARTDSPATIETRIAGFASSPLPEDERGHDHGV